jgi:hypothetical protein
LQVGSPAVTGAQLLDRGDHELPLLDAALLVLLLGEMPSGLWHG